MAKSIYLTGIGACGKTLLSYGFITKFTAEGLNATYFKPVAVSRKRVIAKGTGVDADGLAMKEALGIEEEINLISPYSIPDKYITLSDREEAITKIKNAFEKISANKDLVIIEGHKNPEALLSIGLCDPQVAKVLGSKIILIAKYEEESIIDKILMYKDFIEKHNGDLLGILLNNVPMEIFKLSLIHI